jgi:hypothetical protein
MKRAAAAVLGLALVASATAGAAVPHRSASVLTSSTKPGAKPVALMLGMTFEMQCGNPGKGPLSITLPARMTIPKKIAAGAVTVDGKHAKGVAVHGRRLVISLAQPHFLTCDVIGSGTVRVVVARSAGLGNPKKAGIYAFRVAIGPVKGTPKLRIA